MSLNQSRSERNDSQYSRKSGRSGSFGNQQRNFSEKDGGSGPAPFPALSSSSPSNRRKPFDSQGGRQRGCTVAVNSESSNASGTARSVSNGANVQPASQVAAAVNKPTESSVTQKRNHVVSKVTSFQNATMSSNTTGPTTPSKDTSIQFGSLSPGCMNGMQIPARTSSAPPNLDEQKRAQARHDSSQSGSHFPVPTVPKQQVTRKDVVHGEQFNHVDANAVSKVKDVQISCAPVPKQMPKPSVPLTGISLHMPFHHQQVPMQFGAHNSPIQSQSMTPTLQMSMPVLSMGNASSQGQQPVFVSGFQPHHLPSQGVIHQGQNVSFTTQMGPQLAPQLGNLGLTSNQQFTQQQAFGGTRRPVKITDPHTHKELRLEKRVDTFVDGNPLGPRARPNVPPQSQSIPSFAAHSINYYANIFPSSSSLPLAAQITPSSQASKFSYPIHQTPQSVSFLNPPAINSLPVSKTGTPVHGISEPQHLEHSHDILHAGSSSFPATKQVSVGTPSIKGEKIVDLSLSSTSSSVGKGVSIKISRPPAESSLSLSQKDMKKQSDFLLMNENPKLEVRAPITSKLPAVVPSISGENTFSTSGASGESVPVSTDPDGRIEDVPGKSNSIKDRQRQFGKKGLAQAQHQAAAWASTSPLAIDGGTAFNAENLDIVGGENTGDPAVHYEGCPEPINKQHFTNSNASISEVGSTMVASAYGIPEMSSCGTNSEALGASEHPKQDEKKLIADGTFETEEQRREKFLEGHNQGVDNGEISPASTSTNDSEVLKYKQGNNEGTALISTSINDSEIISQSEEESTLRETTVRSEIQSTDTETRELVEPTNGPATIDRISDISVLSTSTGSGSSEVERSSVDIVTCMPSHDESFSTSDDTSRISDITYANKTSAEKTVISGQEMPPLTASNFSEIALQNIGTTVGDAPLHRVSTLLSAPPVSNLKDKSSAEANKGKSTLAKGRRKKKDILQKADAAGTNTDLYMAYKGPAENKESSISTENMVDAFTSISSKPGPANGTNGDHLETNEKDAHSKTEPDDWEDAADISTSKLYSSDDGQGGGTSIHPHKDDRDGNAVATRKYTRDFLVKFAEQCTDLPEGVEIRSDISDILIGAKAIASNHAPRDSYASPGRIVDRPTGGSRSDRRGSVAADDDKWSKISGSFPSGRDTRIDNFAANATGFRPGQGGNYGVLRNPRGQVSSQYSGGILSGPMQQSNIQGGMQRNNPDADRWQRASNFQKGLIPSPQAPHQVMHKAERKYEIGKVSDEEEAKQRQLKGILNKLTPQNFEKLFEQVKAVNIDNASTLTAVISLIFDKALMEPTFCEMYASFCFYLSGELPDFFENNEKITFKRVLLNKCQEEFERGEREQEEANREEEGEIKQTEEEKEEKRIKARRRMLGNIRLIGELYKKKMLTEKIMHECIKKLIGQYQNPDEEDLEALCKLMSTIGEMIDHPKAKDYIDAYFDCMAKLSENMILSSRVRFMLKDAIDLRKNKWQQRRKVEGPKKIEEVHRDVAQERLAQTTRLSRGPGINPSMRRGAPTDFGPRGSSMLPSSSAQSSFRGAPTQGRYGNQDIRSEDRQPFESRTLSVPLPQRPGDNSITLGPQGGLARGMSSRGVPSLPTAPLADRPSSSGDSRRMTTSSNGYGSVPDRTNYGSREDLMRRNNSERFGSHSGVDQSSGQERYRQLAVTPPTRQGSGQSASEKVWPEERLREKSKTAIKEFYSARDEKEVAFCIKDLNAPSFYPSMISLWVMDSFDQKDIERDWLARLLVNLTKSGDRILAPSDLLKGFEDVVANLEDAVTDAPKAPEFLGRLFAKVILENVIPFGEIGLLIRNGGEEPGQLVGAGLAGDVVGSILEAIRSEKGESGLNEVRSSSDLRLEDFRPPGATKSKKLENFI